MKTRFTVEELSQFFDVDAHQVKDVGISGDKAMVEIDVFVLNEAGGRVLNHRAETIVSTLRAAIVK